MRTFWSRKSGITALTAGTAGAVTIILAGVWATIAWAAPGSPSSAELSRLESEYTEAKQASAALQAETKRLSLRETLLSAELFALSAEIKRQSKEQTWRENLLLGAQARVRRDAAATREYRSMALRARIDLARQLRSWYEQGDVAYIQVLFAAHSFSDLLDRAQAVQMLLMAQREAMNRDGALLATYRDLAKRAAAAEAVAQGAFRAAAQARLQTEATTVRERRVFGQVAALRATSAAYALSQVQRMQRLASQIAATQMALRGKTAAGPATDTPLPGANQIQADLYTAAKTAGVPDTWVRWILLLVRYESGGNPSAVSPATVAGEHASGLLQMLPDTFSRYALPGYDNIWNPVDNAIAAMRYIRADYGAPWNIPGIGSSATYRGY